MSKKKASAKRGEKAHAERQRSASHAMLTDPHKSGTIHL